MQTRRVVAILAMLAVVPVIPYALFGYAGQDFDLHVTSWMELHNAWLAGQIAPGWSSLANFTLGDTHLGMYPPVSMIVGGLLTLLLPFYLAPAAFLWFSLTLSGASMYFASREILKEPDRFKAAVLYLFSPYLITSAIVRFAAAELLVQAWLPLIFLFVYNALWRSDRRAVLLLSIMLGLSWITNIPESIVLFYALAVTALMIALAQRSIFPALNMLLAQAGALALAAFYLIPLWHERSWINQQDLVRADPTKLLLFMPHRGNGIETLKVFRISLWIFALAGMLLIVSCLWKRTEPLRTDNPTRTFAWLAGVAFFFQLPLSLELWRYLPQLSSTAFPFRFLPLMGVAIPLTLLARGTSQKLRRPAYAILALLTLLPFFQYIRTQITPSTRAPNFAARAHSWQTEGYEGLPEFAPAGDHRPLHSANLPLATAADCSVTTTFHQSVQLLLASTADAPCTIRLGVFYYPYWRAVDETGEPLPTIRDTQGLLLIQVPAGHHHERVFFDPRSPLRTIARAISLAALCLVALGLMPKFGEFPRLRGAR